MCARIYKCVCSLNSELSGQKSEAVSQDAYSQHADSLPTSSQDQEHVTYRECSSSYSDVKGVKN